MVRSSFTRDPGLAERQFAADVRHDGRLPRQCHLWRAAAHARHGYSILGQFQDSVAESEPGETVGSRPSYPAKYPRREMDLIRAAVWRGPTRRDPLVCASLPTHGQSRRNRIARKHDTLRPLCIYIRTVFILSSLVKVFQLLDHTSELCDERVLRAALRKHSHKLSVIPELLFLARGEAHPQVFLVPPVIRKN